MVYPTCFGLFQNHPHLHLLKITPSNKIVDMINEISRAQDIKSIGFEKEHITVSELDSLKQKIKTRLIPTQGIIEKSRLIKDDDEIISVNKAAGITDQAFAYIKRKIKKGITEKELALDLEFFIKKHAQDIAFSPIVAFGKNAAIPHYLPSPTDNLQPNTLILLDFGAKVDNYCSDMTRVLYFGEPDRKFINIYQTVYKAQEIAVGKLNSLIKAGKTIHGSFIDRQVQDYIHSQGFPPYEHGLGHGVGLDIHESPRLKQNRDEPIEESMVFTIEPGIYIEGWGGIRIEDLVVLHKEGLEILSKSPKSLQSLAITK